MDNVFTMDGTPIEENHKPEPKKAKNPYNWIKGISIAFGFLSATISGVGAFQLLQNVMQPFAAAATAIVFTLLVQISILALVFAVVKRLPLPVKFMVIIGLLIMWFFSITAAAGSVWFILRSDDYAAGVNQHRLSTITSPLSLTGSKMLRVQQSMNDVAALAEKRAIREDDEGDSCGYKAGSGKGSRFDLRMLHNAEASELSKLASSQYATIQKVIADANSSTKIDGSVLSSSYNQANRTLQNGNLDRIRAWAAKNAEGYKTQFPQAKRDGTDLVCQDPEMVIVLQTAVEAIDAIPSLPDEIPAEKTVSMSEALFLSYQRMFAAIYTSKKASDEPTGTESIDYFTLVPPTIIEFMILLFAMIHEALIRRAGIGSDEFTDFMGSQGLSDAKDFHQIEKFVTGKGVSFTIFDMLERLIIPVHKDQYFVVPLGSDSNVTDQAKRIVQYFNLESDDSNKYPAHGFDVEKLPAWFLQYNQDFLMDVDTVHIYPIPKKVKDWRRNKTRDYFKTVA